MKNRILSFTMLFVFISCAIYAQQEKPLHYKQVGINFSSLNSFGLHYKTGSEKTMLRLSFLALGLGGGSSKGQEQDSSETKSQNYGAGLSIGFEKHVPIVAAFDFLWGLEAGFNYGFDKFKRSDPQIVNDQEQTSWSVSPRVSLILGARYTISNHLVIGAEIGPGIWYSYRKTETVISNPYSESYTTGSISSGFGFSFNTGYAGLSLAYRFGK